MWHSCLEFIVRAKEGGGNLFQLLIIYCKIVRMAPTRYGNRSRTRQRPPWLRIVGTNLSILVFLALAMTAMFAVYLRFNPTPGDAETVAALVSQPASLSAPLHKIVAARPVTQRVAQSKPPIRIGLIAGHTGNDSGAVCADGLTEAQINLTIAQGVAQQLRDAGIHADVLLEFDPRLSGYDGTALVSIHADSCDYFNDQATGFKIAGSPYADSSQLSICVEHAYQEATGLPYHANTITPHMTNYHAFREIAAETQAIIIEVGFMNLDRQLLTTDVNQPISGVANGLFCFVRENGS